MSYIIKDIIADMVGVAIKNNEPNFSIRVSGDKSTIESEQGQIVSQRANIKKVSLFIIWRTWKMIDIKTLRIGSHVEYEGKRVRICSLKTNMANYDDGKGKPHCFSSNLAYYKRMAPIPITPELLEELGFMWKDEGCWQHWWKGSFDLTRRGKSSYWDYEGDISVQHLHELENLYYLIYGTELIK